MQSASKLPVMFQSSRKIYISKYVLGRTNSSNSHFNQCLATVRKHDYENYLCLLLLPEGSRSAAFALRAFNTELAQIRDTVSERNLGQMRIQFWKDALEKIYTKSLPPSVPVAKELAKAIQNHKLTRRWLEQMINAREEKILCDTAFANRKEAEDYAEKSSSSILYLILECLSVKNVNADHAASHIGKAQGLATLIRSTPYHARRNLVYLPTDLMIKHGVSQEEVTRGCRDQKMKDLIYELASDAKRHLDTVASFANTVPKTALTVLLPSVTTKAYLTALERVDFDVFDDRLKRRNNWLPLTLWMHKIRGKL